MILKKQKHNFISFIILQNSLIFIFMRHNVLEIVSWSLQSYLFAF